MHLSRPNPTYVVFFTSHPNPVLGLHGTRFHGVSLETQSQRLNGYAQLAQAAWNRAEVAFCLLLLLFVLAEVENRIQRGLGRGEEWRERPHEDASEMGGGGRVKGPQIDRRASRRKGQ